MKFSELTEYFEKLEKTSSRLSLIEILAELFRKTPAEEIEKIVYLIQGRLAPFFMPIEIGMAEKTVAEALALAYNSTKEKVLKDYQTLGDMGLVAENLSLELKIQNSQLTVAEVVNILLEIANTKGNGTVEKRQILLSDLLKQLDPISAKHLVRIPLGNTRLGIGDPTVLDALATAKLGDKSQRKLLEGAYNRTSDLGLIAKTLWDKGLPAVQNLKLMVGYPVRSELCERLPNPQKVIEKMEVVDTQYKYDGFRCVGGYTPIYTKRKGITVMRDIQVGDEVLTKTGRFRKVLALQKRTIRKKERLFIFKTYLGEETKISEGHPVLSLIEGKEQWKLIENIRSGDEVVFPLPSFPSTTPHL